ncbi:MAG TPA: alpha/beta fold hydrolase [Actinophytocola sp.]|uniref:alpha/beta fold hydrolase n=1 Tax=Actinophytocola sp. TaxID=1872138 RepID=UPI002DDD17C3|nr:alpha/beta fold hydrolase [Actinophytocola sp.]HEV2781084.1 alpha/beta fold hydrolase [Actinophytocola sp.]
MYVLLETVAISAELGTEHTVELTAGTIRYRERGAGPPVVFVHGLLVNADLWRKVVPAVSREHRCLAPDWPLGAHTDPMKPDADLTPPGMARLIAEFLDALDLKDVTVVANDTGGALTQLLMTRHPERIGRVVLTPSDSFQRFFPPQFNFLTRLLRVPGTTWLQTQLLRLKPLHRLPFVFGLLTRRPIPESIVDSYPGAEPAQRRCAPGSAGVRHVRAPAVHAGRGGRAARFRPAGAAGLGGRGPAVPDVPRPAAGRGAAGRDPDRPAGQLYLCAGGSARPAGRADRGVHRREES